MSQNYHKLCQRFNRLFQLSHAMTFLGWDQAVMMPAGGNQPRANALAELASLRHELLTASDVGEWLDQAARESLSANEQASLREMHRRWRRSSCLPAELIHAKTLAGAKCEHAWRQQRLDNDWNGFLGNFREVVKLSREEAQLRQAASGGECDTPYDALLDLYCRGDSNQFIGQCFDRLKAELPALVQRIIEHQRSRETIQITGTFDVSQQQVLNNKLAAMLGFDFNTGRLDVSTHPFSTGVRGDQRICTRYRDDEFAQSLLATAHETGHASYESGLPEQWNGLPIGESHNMCIHESQSLLFEKQIFLSKAFNQHFTALMHEKLPQTQIWSSEALWRCYTVVEPGYIRVEADEVTYPMHVILRYEIESALINCEMEAEDIPDAWNDKMQSYLGVDTRGNYKDGCMQDIHWTDGSFGYFPSYTIGALNSVQFFHTIKQQNPDWQDRFARGDIQFVRDWLQQHIWQHGCFMEVQDMIQAATGQKTNPEFFLQHIRNRYLNEQY
ncbi:carboxypeptidase M32 [Gynuella sunshinyii]|uniref:Metal-dependent carboxypeptidase n=1 Tax=Gynuella sunshinyii YC6258 TaxID=1445510 RepID=A0A0C5VFJ3_9GAMM|nr:carboxypeptidase M32 [Gynuella sunshinyii]AJQ93317.1 Zn-dependent carboxypeptidase [Gynuella sunshinyii YC6258]